MTCHTKTCLVIIPVMMILLTHSSTIFAATTNRIEASLIQKMPAFIDVGVAPVRKSDGDIYALCHEHDCHHYTPKHIRVTKVSEPLQLIMPEPIQEKLPELTKSVIGLEFFSQD